MRKIRVIAVGSKKIDFVEQGIALYIKKMKRYCAADLLTIKETAYTKGNKTDWLERENDRIMKALLPGSYKIACDQKGKRLSSTEFAKKIAQLGNNGYSTIEFIVGGAYGLSEKTKTGADFNLSFSSMTLPHQLFRVFLFEQLYRAYTIINGEKYHH